VLGFGSADPLRVATDAIKTVAMPAAAASFLLKDLGCFILDDAP